MRFCILPENILFALDRTAALHVSTLKEIRDHFPIEDIELVGMAYSMGDGITEITNIKKVENRGVLQKKTGRYVGGGTRAYDEIAGSGMEAVLIPGLHRNTPAVDPRMRALYSHMGASDKVSLSYHAYLRVNEEMDASSIIISDISSNTSTIAIKDGIFFGAIDACLGALGLSHGPLDLEAIRRIDAGKITANEAFYSSGLTKISRTKKPKEVLDAEEGDPKLAREALILAARMEIVSFLGEIKPDAFVITGSAGVHKNVFSPLKDSLGGTARVFKINGYSAARGSAEIARDILSGRQDFLGIGVDY